VHGHLRLSKDTHEAQEEIALEVQGGRRVFTQHARLTRSYGVQNMITPTGAEYTGSEAAGRGRPDSCQPYPPTFEVGSFNIRRRNGRVTYGILTRSPAQRKDAPQFPDSAIGLSRFRNPLERALRTAQAPSERHPDPMIRTRRNGR
jgi:hypothetical protein